MKKRSLFCVLLIILTISLFSFGIGCVNNDDDEVGTGRFLKVETEKTEFVFEIGDTYTTPFAYIVDSIEDRVDGVPVTTKLYNPSGDLLDSVVSDQITFKFVRTGIFSIVYSAEKVKDFTIKLNVCRKLSKPTNFVKNGDTLSWNAVPGATCGYIVSVNGGEGVKVDTPSFTADVIKTQGFYVSVVAVGDRVSYVDSNAGLYQNRTPLNEYELAAFNDYNYCLDIVEGNPKNTNILAVPEFVSDCEGSNGGALKLSLVAGTYGWTIFRLNLQKAFNVSDIGENGGIEIRFKLDSKQYTSSTLFQMLRPYDAEYCASIKVSPETNNEWMILRATMTGKLPSSYTSEEDFSHLQLNVYNLVRAGGKGDLYLDYIKIYDDVLETPTNLSLNNNILTWDSVDEANSYNIEASILNNGKLETKSFVSNTNSIDLSELSDKEYNVRVQADAITGSKVSSKWSEYASKREIPKGNTIADFNSPLYINDIAGTTTVLNDEGKVAFQSHLKSTIYNEDGTIKLELSNDWRISNFNIKLYKPLDLEKDGIEVKFKVESTTYDINNPMIFKLVGQSNKHDYDFIETNCVPITVGEWQVLKLTSEQLSKYYQTGEDVLYFTFVTKIGGNGHSVVALIDDISYYEQLDTPSILSFDNRILTWNAIEGATGYNVEVSYFDGEKVNKKTIQSLNTTIDLSEYAEFNVKVQACSTKIYNSEWSEIKGIRNVYDLTIANFNNELYELDVKSSNINGHAKSVVKSVKYIDGAVEVKVSSSYRNNNFMIALSQGIDFSKPGIVIRFKVVDSGYGDEEKIYFKLTSGNATHNYGADSMLYYQTIKVGEWQTLKLSASDLDAYYNDGARLLCFTIVSAGVTNADSIATILIDDISYYEQLSVPNNIEIIDKILSWDAVSGATGYNVEISYFDGTKVETELLQVEDTTIDLSEYAEFNVKVQAVSLDMGESLWSKTKIFRTVTNPTIVDFSNELYVADVESSNINNYTSSVVNNVKYNEEGNVEVQIQNDGWKHANFKINLANNSCDLRSNGISVRFKVVSTSYTSGSLYFKLVDTNASHYATNQDGMEVVIGEWQTLSITNEKLSSWLKTEWSSLYFCINSNSGLKGAKVTVLLDDISYYEAKELSTPTNLSFDNGVLSWYEVEGACNYNIRVNKYDNGVLNTTNLTSNTNSIDLTEYGECEVVVQAVASAGETSLFSGICSNRTNVIFDFNTQPSESIIASTTTAKGLENSVVNIVTYNEDGTVRVEVKSSYNNQNFNVIPETKDLDLKKGIIIRFKVESTGYAFGTPLYFQYVGAGISSAYSTTTDYGTEITIGEWQTLVLTSEQITASGYYVPNSTNAWKLHFTILAVGGNNSNAVANIVIDDISYIDND